MTFVGLRWANTGASDVHLLPGLVGPELKRLLRALDQTASGGVVVKTLDQMPGLTVGFTEHLNGLGKDHGAEVNRGTGEVNVKTAAMRGRSFIITVLGTQAGITQTTRVRINIHNAIARLWLTPAPRLTVRHGATGVRFSVLALFDDGVIGDITNWSPFEKPGVATDHTYVHADKVDNPALIWSSDGPPIAVDPETGVLTASADAGQSPVTVRFGAVAPATAIAVCARPWTTMVPLDHLGGPGVKSVNFVPNILFLPDGYTEAEQGKYENLVRLIVRRLEYRSRTRPFAALIGRMNYWRGWVASPEAGISVLNEVDRSGGEGAVIHADGVPQPSQSLPTARWEIADLVNAVGLPTLVTDPLSSPIDPKITEWQGLYGTFVTKTLVSRGPDRPGQLPLFDQWLALNDRVLVDERDTAFHMAFGDRPALAGDNVDHAISLNPRRLTDDDFNTFLDALRGPKNQDLGRLWTTGKDRDLVVMVCRSSHVGGVASPRQVQVGPGIPALLGKTIGVSLADRRFHQLQLSTTGGGYELKPDDIPSDVFYSVWLTTAHELGHAFTLGDEYGGDATAPSTSEIIESATEPNVQDRDSITSGGKLDVNRIKWANWQRIAKAGVVLAIATPPGTPPGPTLGPLTVTLDDVKRSSLKSGDIVRLRRRPLATAGAPSPRWRVDSVAVDRGQVVIVPQFAGPTEAIDPKTFPTGSILMAPVRAPDPAGGIGGEKTLADPEVLNRVATTGNPLNAQPQAGEAPPPPPNDAPGRPTPNRDLPVPTAATNFPARTAPQPPRFSSWTIGLYENGGEHNVGFYRPTGICLMSTNSRIDRSGNSLNLYDFCLVCRYAFIDNVDPTLHGQVEQDFIERYGKRGAQ